MNGGAWLDGGTVGVPHGVDVGATIGSPAIANSENPGVVAS